MKSIPPDQVIDLSAGTGGLVHVSVFMAKALKQAFGVEAHAVLSPPAPTANMQLVRGPRRADIAKCHGDQLATCGSCVRRLAIDAGADQQWTAPAVKSGVCALHASRERYSSLYEQAQ